MKKLTLTFWLALAAAGLIATQTSTISSLRGGDDPIPTCPPNCGLK